MLDKFIAWIEDGCINKYQLKKYVLKKKSAFALVIPGGGYHFASCSHEGIPVAKELNRLGYSAFVLRYRTKEKGRYPAPQQDVARALKFILDNAEKLNVESDNYSIWGFSAGGHLAASFCTDNMGYKNYGLPKPACLVLAYPVITMGEYTHKDSYYNLFGKDGDYTVFGSIEKHITLDFPATYVWCCDNDDTVPPCNTQMLADKLNENKIQYVEKIVQGTKYNHGIALGKGTNAEGWAEEAVAFWKKLIK